MASEEQKKQLKYEVVIDPGAFEQILEMDDDSRHEFSRNIVFDFFTQAKETFAKMDKKLNVDDLVDLSSLGHFLKGSSATIGLIKVKDSCEKIQHYGQQKDAAGIKDEDDKDVCLKRIKDTISVLKRDFDEAERILTNFYNSETKD